MKKKIRPVLYSTEMVKAVMEDRKTITRRTKGLEYVNKDPDYYKWLNEYPKEDIPRKAIPYDDKFYYAFTGKHNNSSLVVTTCPYGKVGDILWVRETFYKSTHNEEFYYKSDFKVWDVNIKWKPSIFMPKSSCRIFLEITDVSVERLHDINEEDAIKEGIFFTDYGKICYHKGISDIDNCNENEKYHVQKRGWSYKETKSDEQCLGTARLAFLNLWSKINGEQSMESNPWVWVISFKKIGKQVKFGIDNFKR